MSDLRTRIAAAIDTRCFGCARDDDACKRCQGLSFTAADAVIAELGLQTHLAKRIINGKPDQWVRRHVTDWEIVDE